MNWLPIFFLSVFCWAVSHAQEPSFSVRKAYFAEANSGVSIDNIAEQSFTPYSDDLKLGFQSRSVWLRFEITPEPVAASLNGQTKAFDPLVLRMAPYVLDKLVLHEPNGLAWSQQTLGDRVGMGKRVCSDDTHCFMLKSDSQNPVTVYVEIFHKGVFYVRSDVYLLPALTQVVIDSSSRIAASFTVALSLLFMAFFLFVIDRSWLLFTFVCFQSFLVGFISLTTGRMAQVLNHVSPSVMDAITHHAFNLRVLFWVLLGWAALAVYKPNKIYLGSVGALVLLSIGSSLAIASGNIPAGIVIYLTLASVNFVLQFYGLSTTPGVSKGVRGMLIIGYSIFSFMFLTGLLVTFTNWAPSGSERLIIQLADLRMNGGPIAVLIFLIIVIQQSARKSESTRVMAELRVEAAQFLGNQEKLTERLTLIDFLTHELKNPLGAIRFSLAALKRQTWGKEGGERLSHIDRSIQRMNELIEHVAYSNRVDRFELREEKEPIHAKQIIEELIADYEWKTRFELLIPEDAFFHSNRQMLSLVFMNLIANAYKYDAKVMPIQIQVSSHANATVFHIVNSIDPSFEPDPSKLFQRYYRHDNVQSFPGMGIGLSLVKAASLKIGVNVTFHIEANQVAFTVEVPL